MRLVLLLITALARCVAEAAGQGVTRTVNAPDGVQIRYEVAGLGSPGPTVLFVHGWSNNRTFSRPRFSRLAERHPVVAVDLPGFGESGTNRVHWSERSG